MADPKPGYKSTEFYGSGIATILGGIAASGLLNPDLTKLATTAAGSVPDAVVIINSIVNGIMQLAGLGLSVMSQVKYGSWRAGAKKAPERILIKK